MAPSTDVLAHDPVDGCPVYLRGADPDSCHRARARELTGERLGCRHPGGTSYRSGIGDQHPDRAHRQDAGFHELGEARRWEEVSNRDRIRAILGLPG